MCIYKPMINFHWTLVEGVSLWITTLSHNSWTTGTWLAQGSHSSRNGIITTDMMKRCDKSLPNSSQEESFQSIFITNTLYSTVYDNLRYIHELYMKLFKLNSWTHFQQKHPHKKWWRFPKVTFFSSLTSDPLVFCGQKWRFPGVALAKAALGGLPRHRGAGFCCWGWW